MSSAATTPAQRLPSGRLVAAAAVLVLFVAMFLSTTWWPVGKPVPGERIAFDASAWADENYDATFVPAIEENAVDLATLAPLLAEDAEATGEKYGKRDGTSPYTYAVTVTGTAGRPEGGLLPIDVEGLPADTRVALQIGPAINGTALRDATGLVKFNDFINQVDYSDAAIALNNLSKSEALSKLDPASITGQQITVLGATAPLNPQLITITAVRIGEGA